ncbi:MAG: hypothetical protein R2800_03750 [Flavipsychrobacter sp.]
MSSEKKDSIKNEAQAGAIPAYPIVDADIAITSTANWRIYNKTLGADDNFIRAFYMPKEDIEAMYMMMQNDNNITGCRLYLGVGITNLQPPGSPNFINPADHMNLFMVAVENADGTNSGTDIVYSSDTGNSMVYDFSRPCPSTCDMVSVLYDNES